jgi:hypothetical protein
LSGVIKGLVGLIWLRKAKWGIGRVFPRSGMEVR